MSRLRPALREHSILTLTLALVLGVWPVDSATGETPCEDTEPSTASEDASSSSYVAGGAARKLHSATTLLDGRILVVGGLTADGGLLVKEQSAQIYDPSSGTWLDVGTDFPQGLFRHTATLLKDGRVFIAGGERQGTSGNSALNSCGIFDANNLDDPWTDFGNCLMKERVDHTATRLEGGTILIVGGKSSNGMPQMSAEICQVDAQPTSGPTCSLTTDAMSIPRARHTATRLFDGRVWVSGTIDDTVNHQVEIYDPNSIAGDWQRVPDVNRRYDHSTLALRNGMVVSFGGATTPRNVEIWNPIQPQLKGTATLNCAFPNPPAATLLPDDSVLLFGGSHPEEGIEGRCVERCRFDSMSDPLCSRVGDLTTPLEGMTASLLAGGRVLLLGIDPNDSMPTWSPGVIGFFNQMNTDEILAAEFIRDWVDHTSTLLPNGDLLVVSGSTSDLLQVENGVLISRETLAIPAAFDSHRATLLDDGRVLLTGGGASRRETAIYAPDMGWDEGPPMNCSRQQHTATRLWDGRVLVVGGVGNCTTFGPRASTTYEIYDPDVDAASDPWSQTAELPSGRPRIGHSATLLEGGKVMVAGGRTRTGVPIAFVDIFDDLQVGGPNSPWSPPDDGTGLICPRSGHEATLLADGRVLLLGGGCAEGEILEVEFATSRCSACLTSRPTYPSPAAPTDPQTILLHDGRVLAVGGLSETLVPSPKNLVFEPTTWKDRSSLPADQRIGRWFDVALLEKPRSQATISSMRNQNILVVGGLGSQGAPSTAEVFDITLVDDDDNRPKIQQIVPVDADTPFDPNEAMEYQGQTSEFRLGQRLLIQGSGLIGLTEGSGGQGHQHSASDQPVVKLQSLNNGQMLTLPLQGITTDDLLTAPVTSFPPGPSWLTVSVNGLPSIAEPIDVIAAVDLDISASASVSHMRPGASKVTHSFEVSNRGPVDATDVELVLSLRGQPTDAGLDGLEVSFESASGTPQTIDTDEITIELTSLEAGETTDVKVTYELCPSSATVPPTEVCNELVEAVESELVSLEIAQQLVNEIEPLAVTTPVIRGLQQVDLRVNVTDFRGVIEPGETLRTQVTIENSGPDPAYDVEVTAKICGFQAFEFETCPLGETCPCRSSGATVVGEETLLSLSISAGAVCQATLLSQATLPQPNQPNPGPCGITSLPPQGPNTLSFGPIISHRVSTPPGLTDVWEDSDPSSNTASDLTTVEEIPNYPEEKRAGDVPAVAAKLDEFLLVFEDDTEIKFQFLDREGAISPPGVFPRFLGDGQNPDVTYDPVEDRYFAVWEDDSCLKVARPSCTNQSSVSRPPFEVCELRVKPLLNTCDSGSYPAIASVPNSTSNPVPTTTWITYQHRNDITGRWEIKFAKPEYAPPDPIFPRNGEEFAQLDDPRPRIAVSKGNQIAIVWRQDGDQPGIYVRVVSASKLPLTPMTDLPMPSALDTDPSAQEVDIAYDTRTDRFYAIWRVGEGELRVKSISADGLDVDVAPFVIPIPTDDHSQEQPRIDCHDGRCSVVWQRNISFEEDTLNVREASIIAQQFALMGGPIGDEIQVNTSSTSLDSERLPAIVFAPDDEPDLDRVMVAWVADENGNSDSQVLSRVIPLNSMLLKTLGAPEDQRTFEVTIEWSELTGDEQPQPRRAPVQPLPNVGYFWFFDPANIEVVVKLITAGDQTLIAYASLTDIPFTLAVRDCGVGTSPDCSSAVPQRIVSQPQALCGGLRFFGANAVNKVDEPDGGISCDSDATFQHTLFDRFDVRVCWRDALNSIQSALPLGGILDSSEAGGSLGAKVSSAAFTFSLAAPQVNPEVVIKMIDRGVDDSHWLYFGSATDLGYVIEVRDRDLCPDTEDCLVRLQHPPGDFCGGLSVDF